MVGLGMRGRSTLRDVYGAPPPEYDLHRGRSHMPDYRAPPAYDMHSMRGHSTIDDIENAEYARELMLRMQHSTLHEDPRGMASARHGRHNNMYDMGPHREVMTRAASYVNEKIIEDDEDNLETVAMKAIVMARKAVSAEKLAKDAAAEKRAAENALASAVKEDEKQREAEKRREDEKSKTSKAEADAVAFVIATARKLQAAQGDSTSNEEEEDEEEDDRRQEKISHNRSEIPLTRKDTRQADLPQVPLTRKDTRQADRNNSGVRIDNSPAVRINPTPEQQPRARGRSSKSHRTETPEKNKKKGGFFNLFGGGSSKPQVAPNGSDKKGVKVTTARGKTPVKETKRGSSKSVKRSQSMSAVRKNNGALPPPDDNGSPKYPGRRKSSSTNLDDIAVISNWEHQPDGSITGNISNSPNYEDGMVITTAPVTGRIVVTESGHKYRLI